MAVTTTLRTHVDSQDSAFFKAMGTRIANARKAMNLTQQQLADELGLVQQTVAHYEVGRIRVPSTQLPKLAETLNLTLEELLGLEGKSRHKAKPGPSSKLESQIERLRQLPKAKQQLLVAMLDAALAQTGH